MRSNAIFIALILLLGCAKSENLDDQGMLYIRTTLSITKARIAAHDSVQLVSKLDSVYKKYGISKEAYTKRTMELGNDPQRSGIIFRAIADSLNVK